MQITKHMQYKCQIPTYLHTQNKQIAKKYKQKKKKLTCENNENTALRIWPKPADNDDPIRSILPAMKLHRIYLISAQHQYP